MGDIYHSDVYERCEEEKMEREATMRKNQLLKIIENLNDRHITTVLRVARQPERYTQLMSFLHE